MINLQANEIIRLSVKIAESELVGPTGQGKLKVIPNVGGTFTGAKINGIVPGPDHQGAAPRLGQGMRSGTQSSSKGNQR